MATTDTNNLQQAVKAFRTLSLDDQIASLAAVYNQASGSIGSTSVSASEDVQYLIRSLKEAYADNPAEFLKDVLAERMEGPDQVALDPHPSKAMVELLPGSSKPPLKQYNDLNSSDRLAFWYAFAQQFRSSIPSSSQPSEPGQHLLQSIGSLDQQQKIAFLSEIL